MISVSQCVANKIFDLQESNAERVRNSLLHQIRIVFPGLEFPFWITKSLTINLRIQSLNPASSFGILSQDSEIIIPSLALPDDASINIPTCMKVRLHPIRLPDSVLVQYPSSSLLLKNIYNAFINRHCLLEQVEERITSFKSVLRTSLDDTTTKDSVNICVHIVEECNLDSRILKYFPVTNPSCLYVHPELFKLEQHLKPKKSCWLQQDVKTTSDPGKSHFSVLGNQQFQKDGSRYYNLICRMTF